MQALSHGVVRVNTGSNLTSLTLQDCGQVLPGGITVTVCLSVCLSLHVFLSLCLFAFWFSVGAFAECFWWLERLLWYLILPYLISGVDRLLHLPRAEAVSARPNAHPRM